MGLKMKMPSLIMVSMLLAEICLCPSLSSTQESAQPQLILIVQSDKPSYQQGQVVTIFGTVMDSISGPIANAVISIEIKAPQGNTIFLDMVTSLLSGTYEDNFRLHNETAIGEYDAYATANAAGYPVTMNQTSFMVNPIEAHDIAVASIMPMKTVVGQGYSMNISVTVENRGHYTETFNVTACSNESIIFTQDGKNYATLTLTSGNSAAVIFTWNTVSFAKGNYTISAYAWPVPDETDTKDNNATDGTAYVGVPGDLNGDGTVNILDAILLANHFLETPSTPGWKQGGANADIDSDNAVNILDAIILANHFLQH